MGHKMKKHEDLWNSLQVSSRKLESSINPLTRKRTGSYFTNLDLTDIMMDELFTHLSKSDKRIYDCKFFEPCVGVGNFVFSYLRRVYESGITKKNAQTLLSNIYVSDINQEALDKYKKSLQEVAKAFWGIELDDHYFNKHIGHGLLVDVTSPSLEYIGLDDVFPEMAHEKFDVVVTNPPYKNLKAEKDQYSSIAEYEADKGKYSSIAKDISKKFKFSTDGTLNLYKLFVEEIIDHYANDTAFVSLLIPASILSDKTCEKLRTHILVDSNLLSVKMIREGSGYVDAQQALGALLIQKGTRTQTVNVVRDFCDKPNESADVEITDILNENTGNAIVAVSAEEYGILKKLREFPIVKNLDFIVNLRGELDLTLNKDQIISEPTNYPFLRGRNIGFYEIISTNENDYASNEFVKTTKKKCYIQKPRIVCQQIVNQHKERRVQFTLVPKNYVLANSCNFISVKENKYNIDVYTLLALFNNKIIDWLFKLTSSNNHINNYEIDCFPVPIGSELLKDISSLTKEYLSSKDSTTLEKINELVEMAYGLKKMSKESGKKKNYVAEYQNALSMMNVIISTDEAQRILHGTESINPLCSNVDNFDQKVIQGLTEKFRSLNNGFILNHTTFKLSALDLEMIKPVPQGGSWKDIPAKTVAKSKRLTRITQTGGRSTLYGRIDYNKPSYTITTYFNRPGNGTYVHPIHERVISVREAARFQSFQDDYFIYGNKTQCLKQVGNAVPTLLAYQIGRKIIEKTGCTKSIDLFCGAGGMNAGLKAAGIQSLMSNDIEESACITLKINNPETPVFCGDITKEETKSTLATAAKKGGAEIICGGPPCQGFSLAGYRSSKDPRNQLFREFVDLVKRVSPKIIVFENVEGLLSYQGGSTYYEVHELFGELGYNTEGRLLIATNYAVPQKRKRVIIICVRKDLKVSPRDLYPDTLTFEEKNQITAKETISDLENVECTESAKYANVKESDILKFFKGKISYKEYIELQQKKHDKGMPPKDPELDLV